MSGIKVGRGWDGQFTRREGTHQGGLPVNAVQTPRTDCGVTAMSLPRTLVYPRPACH